MEINRIITFYNLNDSGPFYVEQKESPLNKPALHFLYIEYGQESGGIDVVYHLFQFRHFQTAHHAVQYVFVIFEEAPLAMEAGDGAVHVVHDGIGHVVIGGGDDEYPFG